MEVKGAACGRAEGQDIESLVDIKKTNRASGVRMDSSFCKGYGPCRFGYAFQGRWDSSSYQLTITVHYCTKRPGHGTVEDYLCTFKPLLETAVWPHHEANVQVSACTPAARVLRLATWFPSLKSAVCSHGRINKSSRSGQDASSHTRTFYFRIGGNRVSCRYQLQKGTSLGWCNR